MGVLMMVKNMNFLFFYRFTNFAPDFYDFMIFARNALKYQQNIDRKKSKLRSQNHKIAV
jgi:hypothetical protein